MTLPRHIFKAYDIRGLLDEVSVEIAERVGEAVVRMTGAEVVVVGRDMRATSEALMDAVVRGVTGAGARVQVIGLTTSSVFNFAVGELGVGAGVMITASHNPSEYNGIKCVRKGAMPMSGTELLAFLEENASERADIELRADVSAGARDGLKVDADSEMVEQVNMLDRYLDACLARVGALDVAGVRIGVDYGNGMGAVSLKPLFERIGIEVHELYAEPDASFPHHEANPAKPETLKDLQLLIREKRLDFGIATDGDADRIGFVDGGGRILLGDQTLAVLAGELALSKQNLIVAGTANIGWTLDRALEAVGARRITSKIGWSNVSTLMRTEGAELGGEVSNHFFYKEFHYREAIDFTFLLFLRAYLRAGKDFAILMKGMDGYSNSGEINLEVEEKDAVMKAVFEYYRSMASEYSDLDGHKFIFGDDWWFIIRPSNTEPILRLTVEATSDGMMREKIAEIQGVIDAVL